MGKGKQERKSKSLLKRKLQVKLYVEAVQGESGKISRTDELETEFQIQNVIEGEFRGHEMGEAGIFQRL